MDLSFIPVLVVDDDATARTFVAKILRRLGFGQIHEAEDGEDALAALAAMKVAFVVCDLHMRPMDGLTFLTKLRANPEPVVRALPVIMLTSEMRPEAKKVSEHLGVVDYVVKPTSRLELKAAVEKALGMTLDPY